MRQRQFVNSNSTSDLQDNRPSSKESEKKKGEKKKEKVINLDLK